MKGVAIESWTWSTDTSVNGKLDFDSHTYIYAYVFSGDLFG